MAYVSPLTRCFCSCGRKCANIDVPVNAQYIRNIILAAHTTHDHIVHFYQLSALDWVDITSALQADPTKASEMLKGVSTWHLTARKSSPKFRTRSKIWLPAGQLGIFANGYWGHPAMKLPPEVNLIAVAHYLQGRWSASVTLTASWRCWAVKRRTFRTWQWWCREPNQPRRVGGVEP
ncbi:nickel-dependent hydrogenase large subunit [Escherichia coli]